MTLPRTRLLLAAGLATVLAALPALLVPAADGPTTKGRPAKKAAIIAISRAPTAALPFRAMSPAITAGISSQPSAVHIG